LKPHIEIPVFLTPLAFLEIKKNRQNPAFFSQKGLALEKHCLSCISSLQISSVESLWPCRVHRILQRFYCCPKNDRCN